MRIFQKNRLAVWVTIASMPLLAIYFIFLNKSTIFQDLFYFTILYVVTSINMLEVRKYKIDKIDRFSMLVSSLFWFACLIIIYIAAFSGDFKEYLSKCASSKYGMIAAFLVLFSLTAIKIKLYANDRQRKRQGEEHNN